MSITHPMCESGGQAFPINAAYGADFTPGLTIREYFTIHAPKEIPEWFRPVMAKPKPPETPPIGSLLTLAEGELYRKYYNYDIEEWCNPLHPFTLPGSITDELKVKVADYGNMKTKNWEDAKAWNKEYQHQLYFQWPRYYAENLIKILNADLTPEKNEKDPKD